MNKFIAVPAYYEWHLVNTDTNEVVYNIVDPSDALEDMTTEQEVIDWVNEGIYQWATSKDNEPLNGINPDEVELPDDAHIILGKALYEYYIA